MCNRLTFHQLPFYCVLKFKPRYFLKPLFTSLHLSPDLSQLALTLLFLLIVHNRIRIHTTSSTTTLFSPDSYPARCCASSHHATAACYPSHYHEILLDCQPPLRLPSRSHPCYMRSSSTSPRTHHQPGYHQSHDLRPSNRHHWSFSLCRQDLSKVSTASDSSSARVSAPSTSIAGYYALSISSESIAFFPAPLLKWRRFRLSSTISFHRRFQISFLRSSQSSDATWYLN